MTIRSPLLVLLLMASACGTKNIKDQGVGTLADVDVSQIPQAQQTQNKVKKSQDEIRQAYQKYVDSASNEDLSRQQALTRLAQLELELTNKLTEESSERNTNDVDISQSLQRTISLLETTLRDYPEAQGNDKVLYQLAQAYDRSGQYQKSIETLSKLGQKYRLSLHYPEAQFRLGESAFARGDYITAEDAYTEVILTPGSEKYYEKSLFKRGWTRYKQQIYEEAIDDYVTAIKFHNFGPEKTLSDSSKTQFNEYFRALGLAFSHQNIDSLNSYFSQNRDFDYVYETYAAVSDIFLKQERYSDAARAMKAYAQRDIYSPQAINAELKVISSWKDGGFSNRLFQAIEDFYQAYNPDSTYWKKVDKTNSYKPAMENLRSYITEISAFYHERYVSKRKNDDLSQASRWYERYLQHYAAYANQDKIYSLFGELLLSAKQKRAAFTYFAKAAFDGDIILDKKAAYTTIVLSDELLNSASTEKDRTMWLDSNLNFSQKFVELYPADKRSKTIITRAAEHAFKAGMFQNVVDIANYASDDADEKSLFNVNNLKAQAFLNLAQYGEAESVYLGLVSSRHADRKSLRQMNDSLALSIYRQGEVAKKNQEIDIALSHFTRIAQHSPKSELAATGLYDAIALSIEKKLWNQAIGLSENFKRTYPKHPNHSDVTKKLSVAYLNSDQKGKAAKEFERIAQFEGNVEVKMAALWQAGELYESKNQLDSAIRTFRDYANTYKTPYEPYMESMNKLVELYQKVGETQKRYFWQNRIRQADQNATTRVKTERTIYIASNTTLALARHKKNEFNRRQLIAPIEKNLRLKKSAMQESVKLFGQASSYGIQQITTEATYSIGQIYLDFSKSLLESERPKNLNSEELEQYEILLEDQAFPFEEKAIEFYETNLARTQDNVFDEWSEKSFHQLNELFPVRYNRPGKVDAYEP